MQRADSNKIVGAQSSLTFGFQLNLPVDAKCKLRIIFPSDLLVTDALNSVVGSNIMSPATTVANRDKANNLIDIYGCSTYLDMVTVNSPSAITVSPTVNKGWVSDTGAFKF